MRISSTIPFTQICELPTNARTFDRDARCFADACDLPKGGVEMPRLPLSTECRFAAADCSGDRDESDFAPNVVESTTGDYREMFALRVRALLA
jgi:hypothetical protein